MPVSVTAVVIRRGIPCRHNNESQFFVHRDGRPHVGRARGKIPLLVTLGLIRVYRIPAPDEFAGAHIVGAHHAGGNVVVIAVENKCAGDDQVANNSGCTGNAVFATFVFGQSLIEINLAILAKISAGLAGSTV